MAVFAGCMLWLLPCILWSKGKETRHFSFQSCPKRIMNVIKDFSWVINSTKVEVIIIKRLLMFKFYFKVQPLVSPSLHLLTSLFSFKES